MTSGQKTALSLLISVLLFGAFALAAFAGLFSAIDARFYEPAKISGIKQRLSDVASSCDEYMAALSERFAFGQSAFLKNPSVQTFVESKPSQEDALSRGERFGELRSSTPGLLGFRVLDKNQNSIHYSSFRSDILRRDEKNNLTAYKNYLECLSPSGNEEVSAQIVSCADTGGDFAAGQKIYFDKENRMIFSYPFYDKYSVFRGTALFYVGALDFANLLLKKNLISIGEEIVFLSDGQADGLSGYVLGLPSVGREEFASVLLDAWKKNSGAAERLFSIDDKEKNYWVAVSQKSKSGLFVCGVYDDEIFTLPQSARILILACVFVSVFLASFLALNLRRDDETVIRERIKSLQLGVVDEYLAKKEALDWESVTGRREAVTKEIIQSLGRRGKKHPAEVEALINRSWDELFAAMNISSKPRGGVLENAQEIKDMLQELLSSGGLKVQSVAAAPSAPQVQAAPSAPRPKAQESPKAVADAEPAEDLEEVEEVLDAEPTEDLEEVEDAKPVEDLEEVEDAEPAKDLEEVEDVEPVEDLEEVEDTEPAEDLEEVEEVLDAEPVESDVDLESLSASFAQDAPKTKSASGEEYDISEDISSDFFALKAEDKKIAPPESKSLEAKDKDLDPFFNAREGFRPNEETESIVHNFSINEPDYRPLDSRSDDEKINGTIEGGVVESGELSPEDFGIQVKEEKEVFSEPLDFGAPDSKGDEDFVDVASTFTTEKPHFERDPLRLFSKQKDKSGQDGQNAAAAIPISNSQSFMFSSFGQNSNFSELQSADCSAIVQDSSGVFSIADDINAGGVVQDNSFKRLVDSVLNNA